MSKLSGLACIAAGLAAAAYLFPLSENAPQATTGARAQSTAPPETTRTILQHSAPTGSSAAQAPVARQAGTPQAGAPGKGEIVLRPIEPPQPARAARGSDEVKAALTRDIQKELKRVGCYSGEITGEWSPGTRAAMKSFIDRVNASLPIESPDFILKALVQGHPGNACGAICPAGQSMSGDGRCLPSAVVAQAPRKVQTPPVAQPQQAQPLPREQTAQVPAQAQPAPTPAPAQRPASVASTWETRVFQAPAPQAGPTPAGRMAIGGPRGEPLPEATTSAAVPSGTASTTTGSITSGMPPTAGAVAAARSEAGSRVAALPEGASQAAAAAAAGVGAAVVARGIGGAPRERNFAVPPAAVYRAPTPPRSGGYSAPRPQVRERTFASTIFRRLQVDGR